MKFQWCCQALPFSSQRFEILFSLLIFIGRSKHWNFFYIRIIIWANYTQLNQLYRVYLLISRRVRVFEFRKILFLARAGPAISKIRGEKYKNWNTVLHIIDRSTWLIQKHFICIGKMKTKFFLRQIQQF